MKSLRAILTILLLTLATGCGSTRLAVTTTVTAVAATLPAATAVPIEPTSTPTTEPTSQPTASPTTEPMPEGTTPPVRPETTATATGGEPTGAVRDDLDGKLLYLRGANLWVYTPRDGTTRQLLSNAREARWSPDGTRIAFVRDDGVYLANEDGGDEQQVHSVENAHQPVWSPDGSKIAFERGTIADQAPTREVWVYELEAEGARKVANGSDPAWSPEGERIAYVTAVGDNPPRRNELHIVNWQGQNDWTVVRDLPEGTPAIGIPDNQIEPAGLEHVMADPVWDSTGQSIYVASFVLYQVATGFSIWERADARNGGSTFLGELTEVIGATPAPNRQAVLFSVSTARGDTWFLARGLDTEASAWAWAETPNGALSDAPAWAPDSAAVAYYRCELEAPDECGLRVRVADGEAVVIDDVFGATPPDRATPLTLDWAVDE